MPVDILIVADDLTGAADSSVAFAQRGYNTEVLLDQKHAPSADAAVVALTTESRDVEADELPDRLDVLKMTTAQPALLFKKIDSMVRGNTCAEIEVAARMLPDRTVIISPAYPKLGRICIDGTMHWNDGAGAGAGAIYLKRSLEGLNMRPISLAAGTDSGSLREALRGSRSSGRIFLHDAIADADLRNIAQAGRGIEGPVLWIGSGGLAHALADELPEQTICPPRFESASGIRLLFVGSDHPVTQVQVERLGGEDLPDVVMIPIKCGETSADDIRAQVSRLKIQDVDLAFMTGGDTAMMVCTALGAASIKIETEYEPGVPAGRMRKGMLDGVRVVLKSGGFGTPDLLCRLCRNRCAPGGVNA